MLEFLRRLRRDKRGVSALEFALIAPAMIFFYIGLAETTQTILAERRNRHVASAIGDLVTQSSQVSTSDLTDIFSIAETIMRPYPTEGVLNMRVTSIVADANGKTTVEWSKGTDGLPALKEKAAVTVPDDPPAAGESRVKAESTYRYKPSIARYTPNGLVFSRTVYLRPRKSSKVMKAD
jgi:Flp pilus assembly protein TadG